MDRIEQMVKRQKEREEAMKAKELANKKAEEEKRLQAKNALLSSPTVSSASQQTTYSISSPTRSTASPNASKAQSEREAQERAFEEEKRKRALEAEERKQKLEADLRQRAAERSQADSKGELRSEGNDWLEQKAKEEIKTYAAKQTSVHNSFDTIKKQENERQAKLTQSPKEVVDRWAKQQKTLSAKREQGAIKNSPSSSNNIYIVVKFQDGTKETLYVKSTETVDTIKDTIQRKKHIPKQNQKLRFIGIELTDNSLTLQDYNIYNPKPGTDELLEWCQEVIQGYDVNIISFTNCWKDGTAFAALAHRHREDLVGPWDQVKTLAPEARMIRAFGAFETMGVSMIIHVDEILSMAVLDRLSIITFLGEIRNRFTHCLELH
eukprot:TRINITY_DN9417_c0_g1_i1.p1 TRINITY_DN9417_c0_g1~~TRINITY_DN9417_c0_g1_i1.p1  ORF type:complete len:379 (-),score=96.73 TRINITY_DN9417_c0_g1_i1:5-1141(-)